MKIVLCCAGGFSTTMLMDSMKAAVKKSPKLNEDDFQFDAIPVDLLDAEIEDVDAIVLGPQIAHKLDSVKKQLGDRQVPVVVVDSNTYGQMDGATVLKKVLIELKKIDIARNGR
ncbi:PTS sugar transporter subunit IIB [Olegusella massiliensis]|uniref:PTS sugar transporter subunit IIB n=1 Tax=Olegusella massiliensis TaxID=1776381 RepID=UPI0003AD90A2|nr:PTS sugar transporter subunit IIB [Olegusella massiliensis]ERL11727.1 putative lichenan-specific phosphotransferase enzyme IIB component [Coriobacteriaceae bacterium BV3Ac1]MBS5866300.1 PTS sugar transporter subunit IIB [Coriobacteriaceae bacterium]